MSMLVRAALVLACAAVAHAATCSASGDPHFTMFDGGLHDFQGQGVWTMVDHDLLTVQCQFLYCNPPSKVTCIRSCAVKVWDKEKLSSSVITWGLWPGTTDQIGFEGTLYDIATFVGKTSTNFKKTTTNGVFTATYASGRLTIAPSSTTLASNLAGGLPTVVIAMRYLVVTLPPLSGRTPGGYYGANGLCGYYTGTVADDFTDAGASAPAFVAAANKRYNHAAMYTWGGKWAVAPANQLSSEYYHLVDNKYVLMNSLPQAVVPTTDDQAALDQVAFTRGLDQVNMAQAACIDSVKGKNLPNTAIENCLYDAAALGDLGVAASNVQAAQVTADTSSSSSSSNNDAAIIAGCVLGGVALLALVVAGVMYKRLHKVRENSRALILRSESGRSDGGNTTGPEVEFGHAENL